MKEQPYRFVVRLPPTMRDRINDAARTYRRSMNSEIIARLEESFAALNPPPQVQEPSGLNPRMERLMKQQLDPDEESLVEAFRRLSPVQRQALLQLLVNPR